jgi:hypothetical protein
MPGSEDASGVALWHAKAQQAGGILGTGPRAAPPPRGREARAGDLRRARPAAAARVRAGVARTR